MLHQPQHILFAIFWISFYHCLYIQWPRDITSRESVVGQTSKRFVTLLHRVFHRRCFTRTNNNKSVVDIFRYLVHSFVNVRVLIYCLSIKGNFLCKTFMTIFDIAKRAQSYLMFVQYFKQLRAAKMLDIYILQKTVFIQPHE